MKKWQRQHRLFVLLLCGIFCLSGLLAVRYDRVWDLTLNQRHQLSETSLKLLEQLDSPLQITAFSRGNPKVKTLINRLLRRYQRHATVSWTFKNPDTEIDAVRQYGIQRDGELLMTYQGQSTLVDTLNETAVSRGIYLLLQGKTRYAVFADGQGERRLDSDKDEGYSQLKQRLKTNGIEAVSVDLTISRQVPDNTHVLILAAPQYAYSDAEVQMIAHYLDKGGRLLWLAEQTSQTPVSPQPSLSRLLGARFVDGMLIGQGGKAFGFNDPAYVPIVPPRDAPSPALVGIDTLLVFAEASPIEILPTEAAKRWLAESLLPPLPTDDWLLKTAQTIEKAHAPVVLGLSLTPADLNATQRAKIWLIGDADFASNRYIGQGQNADFAVNAVRQLATPDTAHLVIANEMPPPVVLSKETLAYLALSMLLGVPLIILLIGHVVRKRGQV